jgi:serine/threonine protein kinase
MSEPPPDRVKELFHEAVGLSPEERAEFLDRACGADRSLRRRVERLLQSHDEPGPFLGSPTVQPTEMPTQASPGAPSGARGVRLVPGSTLGDRYRIVELAGVGGMGEVYRARDLKLGQTVALKLLPERVAQDEAQLERLIEEVRIARQVSHPNVCRVYDIGEAGGRHFLSMEWIDGNDLGSILKSQGRLPGDRALFVARQICAGLAAAHDRQIVHRDLKPSNVMLDDRGVARITDFGLAAATAVVRGEKAREGTPHYMSPEQLAGSEVGAASDIYSLGLVLYELFTGKPGFTGRSLEELTQQRREPPVPPSAIVHEIDPAVEKLILRCLATDPGRRPTGARTVLDALPGGTAFREAVTVAQERADRIGAFRAESAELRRAGMLRISDEEQRTVDRHHDGVLRDLVQLFDVDVTERGKQLSLGLRAVSLIGASALAASVYYFFYRIWGTVPTALQVGILAAAPIATLFLTAAVAKRDRSGYFTLMSALVAYSCLVADTSLVESTFNSTPSPLPILAWGSFALILGYGYRLRLLLGIGLVVLAAFLAIVLFHWSGGYWPDFYLMRPEGFLPAGIVLFVLAIGTRRRQPSGFASIYCVLGIVFLVAPTLFIGMFGSLSYLTIDENSIELLYQALGFAMSAGAIWFGVVRRWNEAVYTGTFFLVALLFLEFVNWWWDWMPRYLFFLIVAMTSVAVAIGLKRLRSTLMAGPLEARS